MFPDWACNYVGVRYETSGRSKKKGLDCFGFVRMVYEEHLKIHIPIYSDYEDEHDTKGIMNCVDIEDNRGKWIEVPIEDRKEFDILLFKFFTLHVGIYLEGDYILHCRPETGSCIDTFHHWRHRTLGCYRHEDYKADNFTPSVYR